jgi:hypothetical protein
MRLASCKHRCNATTGSALIVTACFRRRAKKSSLMAFGAHADDAGQKKSKPIKTFFYTFFVLCRWGLYL